VGKDARDSDRERFEVTGGRGVDGTGAQ
jgi:hypothetical protein